MATLTPDDQQRQLFGPHVLFNNNSIYNVKFISSCFSGAVAGILGLENWLGFMFFIFAMLITSLVLHFFNLKANPKKYVQGGFVEVVNPGQENTFSFILVWTLFYGPSFNWFGNEFGRLKDHATNVTRHRSWCVSFHSLLRALTLSFLFSIRLIGPT
jgi:ER membrane protein complex subunit 6